MIDWQIQGADAGRRAAQTHRLLDMYTIPRLLESALRGYLDQPNLPTGPAAGISLTRYTGAWLLAYADVLETRYGVTV